MAESERPTLALTHAPGWAEDPGPNDVVFESTQSEYGLHYTARLNGANPPVTRLQGELGATVSYSDCVNLARDTSALAAWLRDIAAVQQYIDINSHDWEASFEQFAIGG